MAIGPHPDQPIRTSVPQGCGWKRRKDLECSLWIQQTQFLPCCNSRRENKCRKTRMRSRADKIGLLHFISFHFRLNAPSLSPFRLASFLPPKPCRRPDETRRDETVLSMMHFCVILSFLSETSQFCTSQFPPHFALQSNLSRLLRLRLCPSAQFSKVLCCSVHVHRVPFVEMNWHEVQNDDLFATVGSKYFVVEYSV